MSIVENLPKEIGRSSCRLPQIFQKVICGDFFFLKPKMPHYLGSPFPSSDPQSSFLYFAEIYCSDKSVGNCLGEIFR